MRNNKGFTLVELLIVVAIIGILAGAVLIVINPTELIRRSNDSKRLADLDTLSKALNLATADGEIALIACTGTCTSLGSAAVDGTGYVTFTVPDGQTGLGKYLSTLPIDPVNDSTRGLFYEFQAESTNQTFEMNVTLESTRNEGRMLTDGGDNNLRFEIGTAPGLGLIN